MWISVQIGNCIKEMYAVVYMYIYICVCVCLRITYYTTCYYFTVTLNEDDIIHFTWLLQILFALCTNNAHKSGFDDETTTVFIHFSYINFATMLKYQKNTEFPHFFFRTYLCEIVRGLCWFFFLVWWTLIK